MTRHHAKFTALRLGASSWLRPCGYRFAACALLFCLAGIARADASRFRIETVPANPEAASYAASVLEAAAEEWSSLLPLGDAPVEVIVAGDYGVFMEHATGYADLNVNGLAKPSRSQIIVKAPRIRSDPTGFDTTLRHELVHILLERNTDTGHLPRWLNEGIAMMLAGEHRLGAPLRVGQMVMRGKLIPYHAIDRAFRAPGSEQEFGDAYAQAVSMTRYLHGRLGDERFWEVVLACRTMPFGEALRTFGGMSAAELARRYERSLLWAGVFAAILSGGVFVPASFLLVAGWWRKRQKGRRLIRQWEQEEAELEGIEVFDWDRVVEDPDAWKGEH